MATINDGELYVMVEGASEEQLRRGLAAALASFTASSVAPADALAALDEREAMIGGAEGPGITAENIRLVDAFDKAATAAMEAIGVRPGTLTSFGSFADWLQFYDGEDELPNGPHYTL